MKIALQYGTEGLTVDLPSDNVTVLEPRYVPGLPDEAAAFRAAVRGPIDAKPVKELVSATDRVAVVIPDITRALPTDRLLPWLFAELEHVPAANIVIINGTGSHRGNTPEELTRMVGAAVYNKYRIVNHNAHDPATMTQAGKNSAGFPVYFNKEYVQADKRIVLGFIEPHLMAGFSGGYKGIFPGVADIDSIMRYHNAQTIADPRSTWGVLDGNPTQSQVLDNGALLPLHFCINLTLNRDKQITQFFCGDPLTAHRRGCEFSKASLMVGCAKPFPIVLSTNSGYPLDQNLYQGVKGMSAAAQIIEPQGYILLACRCNDGFPDHGNFKQMLFDAPNVQALLDRIQAPGFKLYDQWSAQLLAMICLRARVGMFSEIPAEQVRRAHLESVADIRERISAELKRYGNDAPIAVLPEGPLTIPYLA